MTDATEVRAESVSTAEAPSKVPSGSEKPPKPKRKPKPKMSKFEQLLKDAIVRADGVTTAAEVVSGTVIVSQCKATAPKALAPTGLSGNPFHGIDPDRSPLEVTQQEFRDGLVDGVIAGDGSANIVTAADDTETSVSRPLVHDTDEESVTNAELARRAIGGTPLDTDRVEKGLMVKAAARTMRSGR